VQKIREAAARMTCQNNLKQLALAAHNYHDTYASLPPARYQNNGPTWCLVILPFLEQDNLFKTWTGPITASYATQAAPKGTVNSTDRSGYGRPCPGQSCRSYPARPLHQTVPVHGGARSLGRLLVRAGTAV
jgi:hypothetical protein